MPLYGSSPQDAAGQEGEKVLQGALYAVSGFVDFLGTVVEIMTDVVLNGLSFNLLNNDNTGLEGKYAEFNYELEKYRGSNAYQRDLNRKGKMNQSFLQENEKNISTAMTFFNQGATYEHLKGTYEGGGRGLLAETAEAGINMFLQKASGGTVSINLGYNYNTGYSAGINVGPKMGEIGVAATVGYTEKTGMNVGVGIRGPGMSLMYMEGHTLDSHGRVIETHGWNANVGGVGISYDSYSGYGVSVTASQGFALGGFAGALSMTLGYNERNGFSTSMDVDLEMMQGTNTWNQGKYDEIRNRQSSSSPFGNSPWDVVNNHFQNVFQGFGTAVRNGSFTNPFAEIVNGVGNLFGGGDANSQILNLKSEYNKILGEIELADASGSGSSGNAKLKALSDQIAKLEALKNGTYFGASGVLPKGWDPQNGKLGWENASQGDLEIYLQKIGNTENRIEVQNTKDGKGWYVNGTRVNVLVQKPSFVKYFCGAQLTSVKRECHF
ncbi:hypothetical protein EHQ12_09850 [Leptospira gomenensis]|uniref:Uncharacterized protein n=1 Tax=Leptospira gomenensis TaxID=2484974 RepID=A0A5F1Y9D2_9LEPT|nr:hypothetical protein [Leptospira gomenensis]TGK32503.1 hypothetical protein EHQ17_12565 [Leptospira gomenensis]TGK38704.1 hypothetical protein EHQ12_09850 [Leptospira gomenensis]TGK41922.1 hypothetical protein EHQ07_15335 [Leptospira gomenensis]TGK58758.1 hypothetical protein EHQ13_13820 [Leptospira gomenensis]